MRKKPAPALADPSIENYDKSRSQKKRESTAIQLLGAKLSGLAETGQGRATLKQLLSKQLIDPELHKALLELENIKTHEAKRRHMQYVGKIMRSLDSKELLDIMGLISN